MSSRAIDDNELRYIIPEWEGIYCRVRQDGGVVRVACQTGWWYRVCFRQDGGIECVSDRMVM